MRLLIPLEETENANADGRDEAMDARIMMQVVTIKFNFGSNWTTGRGAIVVDDETPGLQDCEKIMQAEMSGSC